MVTIVQKRENQSNNIVVVSTTEDAEAFLDGLAGRYWGLPGFNARREDDKLVIECRSVGEPNWTVSSTYVIQADAA